MGAAAATAARAASASGTSATELASRASKAPRLARLLWVPLLVAPIRLALGALGLVGARLAGLDGERALVTFALGAGVMMVTALGDPRARVLGPKGQPEPVAAAVAKRALPIVDEKIVEVTGDADDLTIHFADGGTLHREAVFHRAPTRQHSGLAEQLGCEVLPDGTIKVDEIGQTSTPGVSAAGDMAKLPGMPDATTLVVLGAADGVRAAVWMEGDLFRSGLGVFPS